MPQPAVELYLTQEKANAVAKAAAAGAGPGADFAVRRMTVAGWVEELWDLWGDGRVLVGAVQRTVLVARLLEGQQAVAPSAGAARQLASFFRRYASLLADGAAWAGADVSEHERAVLDLGRAYGEELAVRGLIEPDAAAAWLARAVAAGEAPPSAVAAVDAVEPTPGVAALLRAFRDADARVTGFCLDEDGCHAEEAVALPSLGDGVEPRILVPSGATATASLVHDYVAQALAEGAERVLVCGPNAPELFEALAPSLGAGGIACAERLEQRAQRAEAARLWRALCDVREGHRMAAAATDAAANPLVALGRGEVRALNTQIRADRLLKPADVERLLSAASPLAGAVLDAVAAVQGGSSFAPMERAAEALAQAVEDAPGLSLLQRKRESVLVAALGDAIEQVRALGGSPALVPEVWLEGSVRLEAVSQGNAANAGAPSAQSGALVEFASPYCLNSLVPGTYDVVVLSDLSADAFRARAGQTALDELAQKLGWPGKASPFNRQRRRFAAAMAAARRQFACVVPRRAPGGEESYPSFLLQEYGESMAAERAAAARGAGDAARAEAWEQTDEGMFNLPVPLADTAVVYGEDDLVQTVGAVFAPIERTVALPGVARGTLTYLSLPQFLWHAQASAGTEMPLVMSPSALEMYLLCPYSWFIQRRIGQNRLDEQFGPLEEGSFVHAVMAAFYEALAARGRSRVGQAPWADDQRVLAEVFKAQVAKEKEREPGSGRLVAASVSDGLKLRQLYRTMANSLNRQGRFAPGYAPVAHEYAIAPEDGIDYAGVRLNGRVDRIDVNEATGRFVVVDYKGSAKPEYNLGFKKDEEPVLPQRVQALVYAQALRRKLDTLHCAGALYLGYRAKQDKEMLAGAADGAALPDELIGKKTVSPLNFDALLDFVEAQVAEGLRGLYESRIPQQPRAKAACQYCPVPDCAGRLA